MEFKAFELPNNPFHPADFRYWLRNVPILTVDVEYVDKGTIEELGFASYIGEVIVPENSDINELRMAWDLKLINRNNLNELL